MNPRLPLELLDLIIQDLAQEGDLDSVRACSLTSGQLAHICREHLFSSIKLIEGLKRANTPEKFRRLLEQSPSLSSHVRELDIHLPMEYSSEDGLGLILHHLNLVECFIIGFVDFTGENADLREWSSLSKAFVDSLFSFIERNPITELHLFGIHGFPLSTFRLFSKLQKVFLLNVTPSTVVGAEGLIAPIPLTSLNLRQGSTPFGQTFSLCSTSFELTSLKQLLIEVRHEDQNLDILRRLLSKCDCLEDLDIGFRNAPYLRNVVRHISSNSLKTLRNLHITLNIFTGGIFPPYGHFDDELSLISGSNVLEKLEFRIISQHTARLDPTHAAWDRLDEVLSVDGGFPFLKTVKVDVRVCHSRFAEELEGLKRGIDDILEHNFQRLKRNLNFVYASEVKHM